MHEKPPLNSEENLSVEATLNSTTSSTVGSTPISTPSFAKTCLSAMLAAVPLSVAVIPWGILCGTLAIQAGLSNLQAQLMSLIIFAGAAQLAGISMLGAGTGWATLLNTTTMIGVRHVLYSATYRDNITPLPLWKRLLFAFLLTDEMFAIAQAEQSKTGRFDYWYAVIAGFSFYLVWQCATFTGIYSAHLLKDIDSMGFDFAVVATFIAMVVPMIKSEVIKPHHKSKKNPKENSFVSHPVFVAVMISAIMALIFAYLHIEQGLIFATLLGMGIGAFLNRHHNPDEELIEMEKSQQLGIKTDFDTLNQSTENKGRENKNTENKGTENKQ